MECSIQTRAYQIREDEHPWDWNAQQTARDFAILFRHFESPLDILATAGIPNSDVLFLRTSLLQGRVFRLGMLENRNTRIGIFPER